jgi:hypothetical protein
MDPLLRISAADEAELRVATKHMFESGGVYNVLACVATIQRAQIIILQKLNELLDEEKGLNQ